MPVFSYIAADRAGRRATGTLAADTAANARRILRDQGMSLLEFRQARFGVHRSSIGLGRRRRQEESAEFARQMALLLRAGIPLVEALDVLIRQQRGKLLTVLRDVRDRVAAGTKFSEALSAHSSWFDAVFCTAVQVGQLAGQMELSLTDLATYVQERQALRNRLFMALAYPAILTVLGVAVVIFLMSYVVPQLLQVLESSGRSLPAATAFLKAISDVLVGHWLGLLLLALVVFGGSVAFHRWKTGRRWLHAWQLRLPILGPLVQKSAIAQFAQVMSLLLKSGITYLDALRLARSNCRNLVLAEELAHMETAIQRGSDIAPTLADSKVFPPLVLHIVHVGQKTGELTDMLLQLNEGYAAEVRTAVGKFSAAVEPILIIALSAIVGFVVFATMMPILEATRAIQ
jgi:type II secretory pathway component PulF